MDKKAKIVVIGGGFGGARAAQELWKLGCRDVTLIDRKDYFEVTYATLRGVVEPKKWGLKSRKRYAEFIKGSFLQGVVKTLKENEVILEDGQTIDFNMAVIATGSSYPSFGIAKPNEEWHLKDRENQFGFEHFLLEKAKSILIIGGGPVGVEFAGEIASFFRDKSVTLIHNKKRLLDAFTTRCSVIAKRELENLNVRVILDEQVEKSDGRTNIYRSKKSGAEYQADQVYFCVGTQINTDFMKEYFRSTLDARGSIKVDPYLRVEGYDHIYAIGDCSNFKELKLGYLADLQAERAASNIHCHITGRRLKIYKRHPELALIPTGRKAGVVHLPIGAASLKLIVDLKQKDLFIGKVFKNLGTTPGQTQ